jgi:cell division protein FtsW
VTSTTIALEERTTEPDELRRSSFLLLSCVLTLLALGVVMVFSAAAVETAESPRAPGSPLSPLVSHAVKVAVGLALMIGAACLDLRRIVRLGVPFYGLTVLLLVLVLLPGVGMTVNGSHRWLRTQQLLGFALQPSEFAKLALVVSLAAFCARTPDLGASFTRTFLPAAALILLPALLVLVETDFGTFLLLTVLGFLLLLLAGAKVRHLAALAALALPAAIAFLWFRSDTQYVFDRLSRFAGRHHESASAASHGLQQIDFAESAIRVGGLTGVGLGAGRHKLFFLPESENDFILAVIGEELGFVGTTIVVVLFALLLWSGRRLLLGVRHRFGFFVVAGVLVTIAMQALMNLFVAIRWAPVKGIPLPFVSSGGSSLTMLCLGVGLVIAVARQPDAEEPELGPETAGATP